MNIFFDIRTLSVVMGVTIFTLGLSMVYYSVSRKTYAGFGAWTIGAILVSLAFLLIGLRHILPSFITIVVANALIYSALAMFYFGFKSFAEKKGKPYLHGAIVLMLSLILVPFFTYVAPSVNARISLISFAAALYFFFSTLIIVKEIQYDSLIKLNKLLTATLILMSSLFAFRGVFFLLPANTIDNYMSTGVIHGMALLMTIIFAIFLVIGLMQLNSQMLEKELYREQGQLRESEEKHRLLAENTVDCIWQMNLDLELTYINQAVFPFFGYTPEEWIGSKLPEYCSSEEMEKMQAIISDALANLPDKTTEVFETSLYHKNGKEIPCEITGKIILDDEGNPLYFQGATRNIAERKRAEESLKESNGRQKYLHSMTRLMCDNLPDFIWTKDLEKRYIFANKACCEKLLDAKDTDEPVGKTDMYFAARAKDSNPENPEYHTFGKTCTSSDLAVLETKKPQRFDESGNVKGKFLCLDVYKSPFRDEKGNLIGTVGYARDITKEKEIEEERKRAEKEKIKLEAQLIKVQKMEAIGTLAGGSAHDLNNILFPISGYTEMLLKDVPEESPLKQSLIEILQGTKRAGNLVKQILTFSRQTDHELKPLKTQLVIKEALKLIKSSLPSTIEITQNVKSDCGLVFADPTQIHQIVMNLCTNAYHTMEETGGKLTVHLKEVVLVVEDLKDPTMMPGKYVCLTVTDTGTGMDQSVIDRIFDPYFTTKEEGKGTGLGLAVAHGIVKSHGGHISVYSESGKGTEFQILLPVIKKQKETAKVETDTPIQKGDERILLVDDEDMITNMEKQMLERLGYHVTARTSSTDALEAFKANPDRFDLIITDMTMPNMTGEQLAAEIIKIRSDIPVILCTGFSEMMSEEKAKSLGIKGFLMKPAVMKDFSYMIRKVLDE